MRALVFRTLKWTSILAICAVLTLGVGPAFSESNVLFSGGGIVTDGSGAATKRITFSVSLFVDADGTSAGGLRFNFHNLDDNYGPDRRRFTASQFDSVLIETHYFEGTPYTFVRIEARGQLDGMDNWSVLARFSDFGVPIKNPALPTTHADALRLILFEPGGTAVYDTALDYPRDQSWRTLLDGGNVVVDIKLTPQM